MTAVEWLENQISTSKYFYKLIAEINSRSTVAQSNIFEQAKEIEKQQIIDTYIEASENPALILDDAEQYYNKTFKNK